MRKHRREAQEAAAKIQGSKGEDGGCIFALINSLGNRVKEGQDISLRTTHSPSKLLTSNNVPSKYFGCDDSASVTPIAHRNKLSSTNDKVGEGGVKKEDASKRQQLVKSQDRITYLKAKEEKLNGMMHRNRKDSNITAQISVALQAAKQELRHVEDQVLRLNKSLNDRHATNRMTKF
mmetsp:Transcript_31448/g.57116  ORF Transcript_31448/g.57116 Transcript_31448/m.57116 type:complete len:177 (+) Transcript_31448:1269-1799(+)